MSGRALQAAGRAVRYVDYGRSRASEHGPDDRWREPRPSAESGFRNKAKLMVGGRNGAPTLGLFDADRRGVDLRHCGLHEPALRAELPGLRVLSVKLQPEHKAVLGRTRRSC